MLFKEWIYNIKMKIILLFLSISIFVNSNFAWAQSNQTKSDFTVGQNIMFDTEKSLRAASDEPDKIESIMPVLTDIEEQEVTIIEDNFAGEYLQPEFKNLSKLYWKKNAVDLNNDSAVDNFLKINECDIYKSYFEDDFEWLRVRKAARKMLKENKDNFSNKYKIILPIDLGRYDIQREGFPLINGTSFLDLRRIEIGGNSDAAPICGETGDLEFYPRNVILVLSKPFQYDFVKLDEHIAQAYIIRQRYEPIERPKGLKNRDFNRLAFARIRLTFDKYQGETKGISGDPLAIMFGKLDGIDIFEDPFEQRLLTSVDLK